MNLIHAQNLTFCYEKIFDSESDNLQTKIDNKTNERASIQF